MKKWKKISALVLALTLCFTLLTSTVSATVHNYIYYNGNGNTGGSAPGRTRFSLTTVDWELDLWAQVSGPGSLAKTGHTFSGWNSNSAGTGTDYAVGQWVKAPGHWWGIIYVFDDLDLYAKWTPIDYTVTFDAEGGSAVSPVTQAYNTQITDAPATTKAHYDFGGWWTGDNGTGTQVTFPYTVTGNVTLYAKWTPVNYTVTFDAEGGSAVSPVTQAYNTQITDAPATTKVHYDFGGWWTGDDGTGTQVTFPYTVTGNVTLYAKWTPVDYTVTFDAEDGSAVSSVTQAYNTQITDAPATTKAHYDFDGWWTGDDGTGTQVTFPYTVTGNVTLHAKWTPVDYTVTFDAGAGSAVPPITRAYNTQIADAPVATRTHYTFGGWWTGENGTGDLVSFPYTVTGNVTLYAKWNINSYTMIFDSRSGSSVSPVTRNYNTSVAKPGDPTRYGFTFSGWYTGINGTGSAVSFPHILTGNITVYARWTAGTYTISFNSEGGTSVASVSGNFGEYVNAPAAPTKAGHTFAGWYSNSGGTGSAIGFPYNLVGNVTVYAKWTAIPVVSEPEPVSTASQPPVTISDNQAPTDVPSMGGNDNASVITIAIFALLSLAGITLVTAKKRNSTTTK